MGGGGVVVAVSKNRMSHNRFTNRMSHNRFTNQMSHNRFTNRAGTACDSPCCRTAHKELSVFVAFLAPPTPQCSAHSVAYFLAVFRSFLFAEDAVVSAPSDPSACSDES